MKSTDRHETIVSLVRSTGRVTVVDLASRLKVSQETVRRDLHRLNRRGLVRKVHGGATLPQMIIESEFADRMTANIAAKQAIARTAAGLFTKDDSLFVDTGSTTVFFAEHLALRGPITVVTNSTIVAATLSAGGGSGKIFLLGGEYNSGNRETVGEFVLGQLRQFHAEHAVLTCGALDNEGVVMDFNHDETLIARAMIEQARSVTVLVDSSKFGTQAMFEVARPGQYHRLVCDRRPDGALPAALDQSTVELVLPQAAH